ncbi:hypothetical protein CRUP_018268 [Coryphaenoides rupestris]|nr:hypothetical protein CRUP_018268 [Coryphaenoides rupestris]
MQRVDRVIKLSLSLCAIRSHPHKQQGLLHVTNVASNGEHLNRECSLFTDDCRYVIVGSATYVPEDPPPYFFELLDEAEQGNWTAWLWSVALRNRSQKFSKSSSSWSEVFSNTASTSVDTMLYTTKKEGWWRRRRRGEGGRS